MLVRDLMTEEVEVAASSMTLMEAARKMRDGDFGVLPLGEGDQLVGMITDRDIVIRGIAEGRDPNETEVREVMSTEVLYCFEDQTIDEVIENLGDNQIRRLPVLNRHKRLVGILSLGDIAQASPKLQKAEEALGRISEPPGDNGRAGKNLH